MELKNSELLDEAVILNEGHNYYTEVSEIK